MIHYCAHCDYYSHYRANVIRHEKNKHGFQEPNSYQHASKEHPTDWDLMEDSIEVFKIYKLLQRMKNK